MPDTKIIHTPQGWIDDDVKNVFFHCRRLARDARRTRLAGGAVRVVPPAPRQAATTTTTNVTVVGTQNSTITLTSLQQRLYDRLTGRQGVSDADASEIIINNGYNAAASYGHMRYAGALHAEAKIVIGLGSPEISMAYGIARAAGFDHTDALAQALRDSNHD